MHFVISTLRLAYDGKPIVNTHPVMNWLNALGESPFGRQTPDGYPLVESGWASSGQISRRFEIARAIGSGNSGLFEPEDGSPSTTTGFPQLSSRLYFAAIEPFLSETPEPRWIAPGPSSSGIPFYSRHLISTIAECRLCNDATSCK